MRELTDLEREMLQSARWLDLSHYRGELLKELHARAQRLEATLVLTEDQRDKALKERDDVQRLSIERAAEYIAMLGKINAGVDAVIAQRDKAQSQRDSFLADLERVVAERDTARAELAQLKFELDQQAISREAHKPLRDYQRKIVEELYAKSLEAK